jgi:hypothetical protein
MEVSMTWMIAAFVASYLAVGVVLDFRWFHHHGFGTAITAIFWPVIWMMGRVAR